MNKHTPGPWFTQVKYPFSIMAPDHRTEGIGPWHIANAMNNVNGDAEESLANAKLIAAAPEMLEALESAAELIDQLLPGVANIALQDYGFLNNTCLEITKAIRKAKGE